MGKSGVLEHKSGNISETRKIEEKILWRAYRNSPTLDSNGTIPDPLRPPLPQDWGFATPTEKFNRYYLRNGYSYGLQIWPIHSQGPSEQKTIKNFGEKGAWAYPATAQNFVGTLYYLRKGKAIGISNLASTFRGSIRTKSH